MPADETSAPFPRPEPTGGTRSFYMGEEREQGRGGGHRVEQVNSLIARVLQERLSRGLNDPRVQGMVSIVSVQCSPDLADATVKVSVLPADRARLSLSGLRSATRHLQGVVRKATRLRRVPRLHFELDESLKRDAAMSASLQAIRDAGGAADRHDADDGASSDSSVSTRSSGTDQGTQP